MTNCVPPCRVTRVGWCAVFEKLPDGNTHENSSRAHVKINTEEDVYIFVTNFRNISRNVWNAARTPPGVLYVTTKTTYMYMRVNIPLSLEIVVKSHDWNIHQGGLLAKQECFVDDWRAHRAPFSGRQGSVTCHQTSYYTCLVAETKEIHFTWSRLSC